MSDGVVVDKAVSMDEVVWFLRLGWLAGGLDAVELKTLGELALSVGKVPPADLRGQVECVLACVDPAAWMAVEKQKGQEVEPGWAFDCVESYAELSPG